MSGRVRLVVSDVDGTIVTTDKSVLPETIAAASRLRAAGIPLALVSSRPPRAVAPIHDQLGLTGPMAGFNGGVVVQDGKIIAEHFVPKESVRQTLAFLEQRGISAWLFADDQWIIKDPDGDYVSLERHTLGFDATIVDDFAPWLARCGKVVGVSKNFDLLAACEPELDALLGGSAHAHRSQNYYLDVTHPDANKGAALRSIAACYGVELAAVVALGDMTNDVPMFEAAGFSIAMGNAPPAVAAAASVQTGPNTGPGWADAIDRYILPKSKET